MEKQFLTHKPKSVMRNGFDIEWTREAETNLNDIFDYLELMWSDREISRFAQKLDANLRLIAQHPATFPFYDEKKNIRRCVLSSQTTIYYCEISTENKVVILALFDNRRNPSSLDL